tara:strand:+ start:56 stop:475 length:420 start_codon:yes stop_codon:yes gene_type:complete
MMNCVNGRGMMEGSHTERPANKMPFMDAMKSGVSNSFNLSGRSSRSEYWWFVLGGIIFQMVCTIVATQAVAVLALLPFVLIPAAITLVVRRLHDVGKSGWWFFIGIIPLVGAIYLIYLFVQEGDSGENMYGSVPTNMLE